MNPSALATRRRHGNPGADGDRAADIAPARALRRASMNSSAVDPAWLRARSMTQKAGNPLCPFPGGRWQRAERARLAAGEDARQGGEGALGVLVGAVFSTELGGKGSDVGQGPHETEGAQRIRRGGNASDVAV